MNTTRIIHDWLASHGYDGLVNGDAECGCPLDDLMPCDNTIAGFGDCEPAYKVDCGRCRNWPDNLPVDADEEEWCTECNPDYSQLFSARKGFCVPDYMEVER